MENFCQQLLKPLDAYMQGFPLSVCHFCSLNSVSQFINQSYFWQAGTHQFSGLIAIWLGPKQGTEWYNIYACGDCIYTSCYHFGLNASRLEWICFKWWQQALFFYWHSWEMKKNAKIPSGIPDELALSMPSRSIVKNCKQLFLMIENFTV